MEKDKKLEYLKLILKSNGIKWTGKYYTKDKRELIAAKTFDEVVGQEHIIKTLQNAIKKYANNTNINFFIYTSFHLIL